MTQKEFLDEMAPRAVAVENKWGVPANIVLAQAAIESQWGKRPIGNNYFGIKRAQRHKAFKTVLTGEFTGTDHAYKKRLEFADYPTIEAGFDDYGWLITNGAPYAQAWKQFKIDGDQAKFIMAMGKIYATGASYGTLLNVVSRQVNVAQAIAQSKNSNGSIDA